MPCGLASKPQGIRTRGKLEDDGLAELAAIFDFGAVTSADATALSLAAALSPKRKKETRSSIALDDAVLLVADGEVEFGGDGDR